MTVDYKQVIVMRRDLNMSTGKAIAQGAHASLIAVTSVNPFMLNSDAYIQWCGTGFTKVVVQVNSQVQLDNIYNKCKDISTNFISYIIDEGRTELDGPTPTCIAIGPWDSSVLNSVTKRLRLYKD